MMVAGCYKNAFNCKKCPMSNGPDGCPAWLELTMKNEMTGEVKVVKDCYYVLMPQLLIKNSAASDRVTENLTALPGRFREELAQYQLPPPPPPRSDPRIERIE